MKNVKFLDYECEMTIHQYENGRIAIRLVNAINDPANEMYKGEPIATATVNLPDIHMADNQIIIKDYSENQGMFVALKNAGVVKENENTQNWNGVVVADMSEEMLQLVQNHINKNSNKNKPKR